MWCRYSAVNFLTNIHKRHPIARPLGRGMGCLLWIQHLIDIMPLFPQLFIWISYNIGPRYNGTRLYYDLLMCYCITAIGQKLIWININKILVDHLNEHVCWGMIKMLDIFQTTFWTLIFFKENIKFLVDQLEAWSKWLTFFRWHFEV